MFLVTTSGGSFSFARRSGGDRRRRGRRRLVIVRRDERMPDLEKEEAIALFEDGNHSVELVRDWSPEALADLIASINWNYQGAPEVKGALQALYEQRRSEEARRERVRRVRRLAVAAVVVAVLTLLLWEEYG